MRFLLQHIHSIRRRIIFKIIIKNYFCTKTEILLFDLMRIIYFFVFFIKSKREKFSYLHCKLKVKEKVRFMCFTLRKGKVKEKFKRLGNVQSIGRKIQPVQHEQRTN